MNKIKCEKIYVYLALIFGILFVFLTPPFQAPDENSHFVKAYLVSKGNFYPVVKEGKVGNYLPSEMKDYIKKKLQYIGDREKKYSFSEMHNEQYDKMNYHKNKFYTYATSNVLPIVYAAPALGIIFSKAVAKVFFMENISTVYMIYFARLFSLFLTIFIIYNAIRITPIFKKTMTCIALIPMSIFLSSVITYDCLLISLSLLAMAIMLRLIHDKKKLFGYKDIIVLGLIGIILFNVKQLYFLIFGLMFFIPKEKYGNKKEAMKKIIILLLIILGITFILKAPFMFMHGVSPSKVDYVSKQISFILHHPFKYIQILWMNILNQRSFQLNSMIGVFGLIDTYLPISIVAIELFFILVMAIVDGSYEKIKIHNKIKIVLLLISITAIAIIYTAMYVYWTPYVVKGSVGGNTISGVQGRYFLPILFPFLLIFSNKIIKKNKVFDAIYNNYLLVPFISLVVSVFVLVLRFWV